MSFIEKLSSLWRLKRTSKDLKMCYLYREASSIVSFIRGSTVISHPPIMFYILFLYII